MQIFHTIEVAKNLLNFEANYNLCNVPTNI